MEIVVEYNLVYSFPPPKVPQIIFRSDLRIRILQNLDEDDLANFAISSRQCLLDCSDPSLPQSRAATIRLNNMERISFLRALGKLQSASVRGVFDTGSRYTRFKLIGSGGAMKVTNELRCQIIYGETFFAQCHCLDMSFSSEAEHSWKKKDKQVAACIPRLLSKVMPNIREVDLFRKP
jgi:hypothetical protein